MSDDFAAAVHVLFKPDEFTASVVSGSEDAGGQILHLNEVTNPAALPPYWTLSVPSWYLPEMGNIEVPGYQHLRRGDQVATCQIDQHGAVVPGDPVEVYPRHASPFLVFEIDTLLFTKDQHPSDADKRLQAQAMAYAFQASGFPFAVLTDSGSKSVHATVRLDDDAATIQAWRQSPEFDRLLDLAAVVFGDYDQGVLTQSGRVRLVRTPGAVRENGQPQTLLAVGRRVTIKGLMEWFASQLNAEAQQEVFSRAPIKQRESVQRQRYLRLPKWRSDLCKPHVQGERGTHWFHVSKSLMVAGCCEPRLTVKPSPQAPHGQWVAAWLWHLSAFVFNHYSNGWFFSHDPRDWGSVGERTRWDAASGRDGYVREQRKFEGATDDPARNALIDQMLATVADQSAVQLLPPPPMVGPPVHMGAPGQIVGASLQTGAPPPPQPKKQKSDFGWVMDALRKHIPKDHLIKLSEKHGGSWYLFTGRVWEEMSSDFTRALLSRVLGLTSAPNSVIAEVIGTVERTIMINEAWTEYPNAIAFLNGTLYVDASGVEFVAAHDPADRLRSVVPCNYDPQATCPRWDAFVQWALPEPSRLSLLQEAFGYTLVPGQPFQSFFMMTGTGSNGKSVVLAVLQAMHKDAFETVALANLGGRFSLGTIGRKRLAIDTEAENVNNQVMGEGNSATAILKSWTGGDPVKIEAKRVQGWSETINAKYFMSCNKKPRFVDPTKGVWRRLKLLRFEASVDERQADTNLPQKLVASELPGIVNWSVRGLLRLFHQNGFTTSDVLKSDLREYQIDSDSVALFLTDFMRAAPDAADAWFDIRPFHKAYKERCLESGHTSVSEVEFRQRLEMLGVVVGRPGDADTVNNCPIGTERVPGQQYWAIKGWRCYHPAYTTASLIGNYVPKAPMPAHALRP